MYDHDGHMTLIMANTITVLRTRYVHTKMQEPEFILVTTCSVICKEDGRRRRNQNSFWSQPAALSAKKMEEDAGTRIHSGHNLQRYLQRRWKKTQEPEFILVTTCSVICKEDRRWKKTQARLSRASTTSGELTCVYRASRKWVTTEDIIGSTYATDDRVMEDISSGHEHL